MQRREIGRSGRGVVQQVGHTTVQQGGRIVVQQEVIQTIQSYGSLQQVVRIAYRPYNSQSYSTRPYSSSHTTVLGTVPIFQVFLNEFVGDLIFPSRA